MKKGVSKSFDNKSCKLYFDTFNKKSKVLISKRSQVTVFVIVAIILVAVGGVGLFVAKNNNSNNDSKFFSAANSKPELANVKTSILSCRDSAVLDAMNTIGIQGGYSSLNKPENIIDLEWTFVPYYYDRGKYSFPNVNFVSNELSKQIDIDFVKCVDNLEFNNFEISHSESKTKATIKKGNVNSKIDMSLSINNSGSVYLLQMKDAPVTLNSSLFDIIEVAEYITMSHKNDSEMICVTCVADMAEERNLYVNSFDIVNNSLLYVISENYTSSEPYYFEFLNRYPEISSVSIPSVPSPASPASA